MVVHCLELITDTGYAAASATSDLQTYRQNHSEVLDVQASDLATLNTQEDGSGTDYYHAMFRFAWSEDLATLKSDAEAWPNANFTWWAWRYHQCDHDEAPENRTGCSWSASNHGGTVPAEVASIYQ